MGRKVSEFEKTEMLMDRVYEILEPLVTTRLKGVDLAELEEDYKHDDLVTEIYEKYVQVFFGSHLFFHHFSYSYFLLFNARLNLLF